MFLVKQPSVVCCVLNSDLRPPHDLLHDIQTYPLFYDALYYPQYHLHVFSTAESFCSWLQLSLRFSSWIVFNVFTSVSDYVCCLWWFGAVCTGGWHLRNHILNLLCILIAASFRWSIPPKQKIDPKMSDRDKFGSRNYQLILRRMQLLPCTSYIKPTILDPKGKRKASEELHGQSPAKKSAGAQELLDMVLWRIKKCGVGRWWSLKAIHLFYCIFRCNIWLFTFTWAVFNTAVWRTRSICSL